MTMLGENEVPLGVPSLDHDHIGLWKRLRELTAAASGETEFQTLVGDAGRLIRDVESHFRLEEQMMEKIGFPDRRHHIQVHRVMLEVSKLKVQTAHGVDGIADWVSWAVAWFYRHHVDEDLVLALALLKAGVQ